MMKGPTVPGGMKRGTVDVAHGSPLPGHVGARVKEQFISVPEMLWIRRGESG